MSLSKELCLRSDSKNSFSDRIINEFESNEDNYRRDSFGDRICDDLCEFLLQFLSLEDKIRLQCVSKQFQRTVFKRHYELYIPMRGLEKRKIYLNHKYFGFRRVHNFYDIEDRTFDLFKALLKKCPNIKSIVLDGQSNVDLNSHKFNQVFQMIIESFNNLSEVIAMHPINDSNFEEFHRKFGPKIKYLSFIKPLIVLNRFPNIEKLVMNSELIGDSIIPQLKLAKLKQLEITFSRGQGSKQMFHTVIDSFPTLTHLKLVFYSQYKNEIYKSLENISNLKHLIHFVYIEFEGNNERFCDLLKQMANNCRKLKSIVFGFKSDVQNSNIKQLLSHLKAFSALKRLKLFLFLVNNNGQDNIDVNRLFSFKSFQGFSNMTHLRLCFILRQKFEIWALKGIDINLPKLQYLEIKNTFDITPEGVTEMADILSRLSRLETLKLKLSFKTDVNYDPIEEQITKQCRKIRKIEIKISNN